MVAIQTKARPWISPRDVPGAPQLSIAYHDQWGVPVHDDKTLFEFLTSKVRGRAELGDDSQETGAYRRAFVGFDATRVAKFRPGTSRAFARESGIVRNRLKIGSTVGNAKAFLAVHASSGVSMLMCGLLSAGRRA